MPDQWPAQASEPVQPVVFAAPEGIDDQVAPVQIPQPTCHGPRIIELAPRHNIRLPRVIYGVPSPCMGFRAAQRPASLGAAVHVIE